MTFGKVSTAISVAVASVGVLTTISPAALAAKQRLVLPTPRLADLRRHPENFTGHPIQLCGLSADIPAQGLWPIEVRGADGLADRACLVGELRKAGAEKTDGTSDGGGWIFDVDRAATGLGITPSCLTSRFPKNTQVVVHISKRSDKPRASEYTIAGTDDAARLISVAADRSGPPLIAVFSARDPIIWDFAGMPANRLKAVLLVGVQKQAVARLRPGVELHFLTPEASEVGCESPTALQADRTPEALAAWAQQALNRNTRVLEELDPVAINLDGGRLPRPDWKAITPSNLRSTGPITHDPVPPGVAGLTRLFQQGAIRNATQADADAWLAARERSHLPTRGFGPSGVYVIMRPVTIPRDMYGGNSANFLILVGVPMPTDLGSHNTYFTIADGRCKGASPQCD